MLFLLLGTAFGYREPVDYIDALVERKVRDIQIRAAKESLDVAVSEGRDFLQNVVEHPNLYYEIALLYNKEGELNQAIAYYSKALEIRPKLTAALYDRAEIYLVQGKYELAYNDLIQAKDVKHWVVHLRLAEVAAYRRDIVAMERSLLRSLELGLDLRDLSSLGWKKWAKDSSLQPSLQRIILLYGGQEIWNHLTR
ncbi:MAG: tetratricopeptide repeat protein [Myxococcota bacterium]|nr:tetratricopeptide repeat protein [Myxococcota bacterium]